MRDSNFRSITKALTWRVLATYTTIILVYAFTKELTLSIGIGALELITKLLLYYFHERVWNTVHWGRKV